MLMGFKGWAWLFAVLAALGFTIAVTRWFEPTLRVEPVNGSPAVSMPSASLVSARFSQAVQARRFLPQTNRNQRSADQIGSGRMGSIANDIEIGWRFVPYVLYPISGYAPSAVAIGDVSGDGRNDVIMVVTSTALSETRPSNKVLVFRQDIQGGLLAPDTYDSLAKAGSSAGMVLVDLNADDVLDIVVGHESGITSLVHTSDGFVAQVHPGSVWSYPVLAVMDLNFDGRSDVVAQSWGYGGDIFYGDGQGGFSPPQHYPLPPNGFGSLEVGDVTSDGLPDLIVARTPNYSFWVYPLSSSHSFESAVPYYTAQARQTFDSAVGDFNSDGRNDVAVSLFAHGEQGVEVFLQDSNQRLSFASTLPVYVIPEAIAAADLDGDGRTDLVTMDAWEKLGYYLQGPGGLGALNLENGPPVVTTQVQSDGMAIGDTNSDGCLDVAVAYSNTGLVLHRGVNCKIQVPPTAVTCRLEEQVPPVALSRSLVPMPRLAIASQKETP